MQLKSLRQPQVERELMMAEEDTKRITTSSEKRQNDQSQSYLSTILSWLWPGSLAHQLGQPCIHIALKVPYETYRISTDEPLRIEMTSTLQPPYEPITVYIKNTMFKPNELPESIDFAFDLVDTETGEPATRTEIDVCTIDDHWGREVSYNQENNFTTLYPGVPVTINHLVRLKCLDVVPLQPGRTYRVEINMRHPDRRVPWWTYGPKWRVLKWKNNLL